MARRRRLDVRPREAGERRRPRLPRGRRPRAREALDRARRASGALDPLVAPAAGRRRLREPPSPRPSPRRAALGARRASPGRTTSSTCSRRARVEPRGTRTPASTPTSSTASSGQSPTLSPGHPWTCRGVCASGSGKAAHGDPRLRDADDRATSPSCATGSASAARASFRRLALRLPRAGAALPARGLPDPRARHALARVAEEAAALCELSEGRALVLTSSYRALEESRTASRAIVHELLVAGRCAARAAPRALPLRGRVRARRDRHLLAGRRHPRRGALAARDRQAPLPRPGDPLVEARCERSRAEGGDWFATTPCRRPAPAPAGLRAADPRRMPIAAWSRSSPPPIRTRGYGARVPRRASPRHIVSEQNAVREFLGRGAPRRQLTCAVAMADEAPNTRPSSEGPGAQGSPEAALTGRRWSSDPHRSAALQPLAYRQP